MAEIHKLMQDQIDELQQPAAAKEATTSQRQEPAREVEGKAAKNIKRVDKAAQVLQVEARNYQPVIVGERHATDKPYADDNRHTNPKKLTRLEVPVTLPTILMPEDMLTATAAISSVFDEETPLVTLQPNAQAPTQEPEAIGQDQPELDMLFDFQELETSIDEIEPYVSDASLLVAEEALPRSTDQAETDVLSQPEAIFDDEVMDTFEQLMELVYEELAEIPASGIEQHAELIDDQVIFIDPETPEPIKPNAFKEFVASVPKPEVTPDLNTIMASANEQTLEETLVQLSLYLTETSQDSERPPVIQKTLRDLAELLSSSSSNDVIEKEEVLITPELTQRLLTLLRAVGYDNPQAVLLAFVKEHDFEFLLEAIRHLSQLCNDDARKEVLPIQVVIAPSESDEPLTARLGKVILSLMIGFKVPEVAISD